VIRALYSTLMWLAQPLLRRKLRGRGQSEPGYLDTVDERFGRYASAVPAHDGPTVWIHAVSLGETRAAAVLIDALRQRLPAMRLLLTHGTATGRAEGGKLLRAGDLQAWQPWDTPGAVQRFLHHFQPAIGVLMETEIWPNLVHGARARGVPLLLANARLSDQSLRQAQRLAWLARPAYAALTAVWAQTETDAQRLRALGAPVRAVLGNLKFDAAPDAHQLATGRAWRARGGHQVVMFASSREGEELALLQLLRGNLPVEHGLRVAPNGMDAPAMTSVSSGCHPGLDPGSMPSASASAGTVQWLIVPRHPQRFDAVAALIESQGFAVSRRSDWPAEGPPAADDPASAPQLRIWLGDSLGEMAQYYGLADAALLGGSFAPLGGQNLIEAAACACPVIMGLHTFNFAEAAEQAVAAGAALRVADMVQAVAAATALVAAPERLSVSRQAATRFAQTHQGAAARLAEAVCQELTRREASIAPWAVPPEP